ncbi:PhaM family polyhydroxyalkanoate granule multifunctional regulatory protein [Brackiella oedipodis]|uniref:PhaM family polyhydroxyalkanoate granule multifunctional regulatory protein n=1 Tax=Brackiella oedipodis TaxID=124225 RepID=UPI0004913A96|nr:PhaM family polyhydroxyalkanoate granule multifunctional regulatory protein [Brackiella oedipodis]
MSQDFFKNASDYQDIFENLQNLNQSWQQMAQVGAANWQSWQQANADIDKRIQDLKTIEAWLALNHSMLKNTIQSLEMQRSSQQAMQDFMKMAPNAAAFKAFTSPFYESTTTAPDQSDPQAQNQPQQPQTQQQTSASDNSAQAQAMMQNWFSFLQQQYQNIATQAMQSFQTPSSSSDAPSRSDKPKPTQS